MKFRSLVAGLTLTLIGGAAFAQTSAATGADATMAGPGITMGKMASGPLKYVNIQDTDIVTSKLIGVDIYNKQNDKIGEVSDIVIGGGKSVIGIVASVGGFLGLGESYVVLDPSSVALADDNGTWKAYVDTSKEDLTKAPKLDYSKFKK
ncbi:MULTISPECIES: PRC-barrel domain-containing protein [Rhizobium]|uniref:PRC-barrel domain-containing protein n=1 Tax=Rhizobium rhododendri TaxID=2506430 RepID=A0ABY8ID76_9HYPH|nr:MULTISPECIES: PRC-barrel domain-containing protein [Rhizobium]MBO9099159.1 PRC-barrel domain-containing protein [Rhizobium sp. L58/93]MBO9132035.1 PRC-barrel domain-containing protein [Rhizobium sp. B209b/85]MBO9169421.1 PRC-barrel domain-containing protein [Rhizobium sp. L245/93]MBO9185372.1 PRC-barrel domain-containing protein [Rhizobium sp. E27B/91]MBZ5758794.1 PRC-barrel domain-containing protein [Rhizobium sp. VS19-DR96]